MGFKDRIDFGHCENCPKTECLLTVFIHHPTNTKTWVCSDCTKNYDEALQQGQVPGLLGEKIQKAINGQIKVTG